MIPTPQMGEPCAPFRKSPDTLELLATRRSTPVALFEKDGGPSADELDQMLAIGARISDHRRVYPFRFILIEGEARARAGAALKAAYLVDNPDATEDAVELEGARFLRAPVVITVVAATDPEHKTPEWEQVLTVGAVCQNLLIAASASGYAAQWLTEWYAFNPSVMRAIGLNEGERVAGFVFVGTARENPLERPRPDLSELITRLD